MNFTEKRLFLKSGLIYALIQIILYIPIHLTYTGGFENAPEFLTLSVGILSSALSEFAYFSLPIFAAVILFVSYAHKGFMHALPRALVFSLPYFISALPEYYLIYLKAFDSSGAIFFSFVISLLIVFAVTAQILALVGIICFFVRFPKSDRFEKKALEPLCITDMSDFSKPFAKGLLFAVLAQFLISFITEVVTVVTYIIENSGTYRTSELITIVLTFLFIALELLLTYIFAFKLKNKLIENRVLTD